MSPRLVKFEPRHPQGIEASAKGEERPKGEVDGCAAWAWAQSFGQEAGCAQTGGRV